MYSATIISRYGRPRRTIRGEALAPYGAYESRGIVLAYAFNYARVAKVRVLS
jgi:hypothetical protein